MLHLLWRRSIQNPPIQLHNIKDPHKNHKEEKEDMEFSIMGIAHEDAPDKEENWKRHYCEETQF